MTVSYQSDVASSTSGGLIKLLWRWRGSVWKLVYRELVLFVLVFLGISLAYRYLFTERLKKSFEYLVIFCSAFVDMIPLSFILGFYVSFTATRWWNQYTAIPWPDKLMNNIAMYVPGSDETSRMLRRTLMRYLNLTLVLVLRSISIAVKRRFPTKEHLVEAGFMTKQELDMHTSVPSNEFNTFWIPCTWFINLLREARQECRITDSSGLKLIMEEFNEFRSKCGLLWSYDWVSIPLVYTQVVTIATYAFFIASIFGRQRIDSHPKVFNVDIEHRYEPYIPIFTILQFLLYMGLLKLGEQLINPFGDDDEDFELNWIIDRHLKVSFLGVDILNGGPPPMVKDNYWDDWDIKLPYTAAAVTYKKRTYRGSMAAYHVPSEQQGLVVPEFTEDDECESDSVSDRLSKKDKSSSSVFGSVFGGKFSYKRNESLISLGSEMDFEATFPRWRGSSASFLLSGEEEARNKQRPSKQESDESDRLPTSLDSERLLQQDQMQGIKGEMFAARKRVRKSSDQTSITMLSTSSANEDKSSDHERGATVSSVDSTTGPSKGMTSRYEANFDPTMGIFVNKFRVEGTSASRRPSNASLPQRYISRELKSSKNGQSSPSGRSKVLSGSDPDYSPLTGYEIPISRSSSSASKKAVKNSVNKPGLLKMAKTDPRLKIRPYVKSRVTFSDDTKSEMNKKSGCSYYQYIHLGPGARPGDLTLSSPELSEADLTRAFGCKARIRGSRRASELIPPIEKATLLDTSKPIISTTFVQQLASSLQHSVAAHRRTSCDQVSEVFTGASTSSSQSEFWLRHQSLPNIQEMGEESPHQSPTSTEGGVEFGLVRIGSRKGRPQSKSSDNDGETDRILTQATEQGLNEGCDSLAGKLPRSNIARQSEIDEDVPMDCKASGNRKRSLSASEKRSKFSENSQDSGSSVRAGDSHQNLLPHKYSPRSARARRATGKASSASKQSSTDSESYATACSVFVPICEEDAKGLGDSKKLSFNSTDSSISSFSSAKDQQLSDLNGASRSTPRE